MATNTDGIIGIQRMSVSHAMNEATTIDLTLVAYPGYDPHHLLSDDWKGMFPGSVVVKCGYCGQWAARRTACKHCGAAVE